MIRQILGEGKFMQPNMGDKAGTMWGSKNIDLDSVYGSATLSRRSKVLHSGTSSQFGVPLAIVYGNFMSDSSVYNYWLVTNNGFYTMDTSLENFQQIIIGGTPTTYIGSDGVSWNGTLCVTTQNVVAKLASNTWTVGTTTFAKTGTGDAHPLCVAFNNLLLAGDGNLVKSISADMNTHATKVTLPSEYEVRWIRSSGNAVYIGTRNIAGGSAKVFVWDGASANFNQDYPAYAPWSYSGVIAEGTLYTVTSNGQMLKLYGSGLKEAGRLPSAKTPFMLNNGYALGNILQRGMAYVDGTILISIDNTLSNDTASSFLPTFNAGIYAFSEETGLVHRYGFSQWASGDESDFGEEDISAATGCILEVSNTAGTGIKNVLFSYRNRKGTQYYVLDYLADGENRGYIVTPKISAIGMRDSFKEAGIRFDGLLTASDKIIVKYRSGDQAGLPLTADRSNATSVTWSSATAFTTASTLFSNVVVGNEVEVLAGPGAGSLAHVSAISYDADAATYAVTLDESIPGAAAAAAGDVMVSNFAKILTITSDDAPLGAVKVTLDDGSSVSAPWAQFKIELRGSRVQLEGLDIDSDPDEELAG